MRLAGGSDTARVAKRCARAGRLMRAKERVGADDGGFQVRFSLLGVLRNATIGVLRQARRDVIAEPSDERQSPSSSNLLTNQTRRRRYRKRSVVKSRGVDLALNPYESPVTTTGDAAQSPVADQLSRPLRYALACMFALPLISYLYALLFWLMASVVLGEWARPGVHDPMKFLFGVPLSLHLILMLSSFAVAPLVCVIGFRCGKLWQYVISYTTCLALSIVLFRLDLFEVSTWIAD